MVEAEEAIFFQGVSYISSRVRVLPTVHLIHFEVACPGYVVVVDLSKRKSKLRCRNAMRQREVNNAGIEWSWRNVAHQELVARQ